MVFLIWNEKKIEVQIRHWLNCFLYRNFLICDVLSFIQSIGCYGQNGLLNSVLLESVYILYNNMCDMIALEICILPLNMFMLLCKNYPAITPKETGTHTQIPLLFALISTCSTRNGQEAPGVSIEWECWACSTIIQEPATPGKFEAA